MRFASIEPAQLSQLIGHAYDAALSPAQWSQFLAEAARAFDCEMGVGIYLDHGNAASSFITAGGLGDQFATLLNQRWDRPEDDYWWQEIRAGATGSIYIGHEVLSDQILHDADIHERLGWPWRPSDLLGGVITNNDDAGAWMTLIRADGHAPFNASEKQLFASTLIRHLNRSVGIARQLQPLQLRNELLTAVLDRAPYGIVIFDHARRPLMVNQRADQLFTKGHDLRLVNGSLRLPDRRTQAMADEALSAAIHIAAGRLLSPPRTISIDGTDSGATLTLAFVPFGARGREYTGLCHSSCLLLIHDQVSRPPNIAGVAGPMYGLTPAEIRICELLFEGMTLSAAAEACDVTRNTAKTHLGRVFEKTGVHSQLALLRLLTAVPRPGTPRRLRD